MKKFLCIASLAMSSLFSLPGYSANLLEVYRDALENDAAFKASYNNMMSNKELLPIAQSTLFPQVFLSGDTSANRIQSFAGQPGVTDYSVHGYTFTATQPLINYANWMQILQASYTSKQAAAEFAVAAQDLILRTAQAYFSVLQAQDDLRFTRAEKKALKRQLDQTTERFKVGLVAITDVYDAQAKYDAVTATEIANENSLSNSYENLREITTIRYTSLAPVKDTIPLLLPKPNDINHWVDRAKVQNVTIIAAKFKTLAAKEEINIQFAGHLPTVNAVGTFDRHKSELLPISNTKSSMVGVQATLPLFLGGAVMSQTKKARYDYQTAYHDSDAVKRNVENQTRKDFRAIQDVISKIKADSQTIKSSAAAVDSSEAGYEVGTRTIVDVLDNQTNLYDAQRNYALDRYIYLQSILRLQSDVGSLSIGDINQLNSWLSKDPVLEERAAKAEPSTKGAAAKKTYLTLPLPVSKNVPATKNVALNKKSS